ncbi:MAG: mechanosensitive ion channel family protein [Acidobacteriaceae bacterium]
MPHLTIIEPSQFFSQLGRNFLDGLLAFAETKLLKLLWIAIGSWILIRVIGVISHRIVRAAERHSTRAGHLGQVKTLTGVVRATGVAIVAVIAALEVLPLLGLNLGPLLTSAGVAGVAIGLASQAIVKDCLNGFLILVEDQYSVGDVIKVAGLQGTVEEMSLRKTILRDGDGTLYTIPNSQITTVGNLVRDFSLATVNVAVDFSENPEQVIEILRKTAMSVREDPQFSELFLADPVLLGVDSIKGSQVIYPVQFRVKANKQWGPVREFHKRVRLALEEHHILPGDAYRVYTRDGAVSQAAAVQTGKAVAVKKADPTAAKSAGVNPFTGDSQ